MTDKVLCKPCSDFAGPNYSPLGKFRRAKIKKFFGTAAVRFECPRCGTMGDIITKPHDMTFYRNHEDLHLFDLANMKSPDEEGQGVPLPNSFREEFDI